MKKTVVAVFSLAAAALFAAEANLYHNAEFKDQKILANGKFYLSGHWYEGVPSNDGTKYNGHMAIKLSPIKKPWGYSSVLVQPHKLAPGKYTFSIWCKTDKNGASLDFLHITNGYRLNNKHHMDQKKYTGADKPVPEKWTELVYTFEVKPEYEKGKGAIYFGQWGREYVDVWFSNPKLVKVEEE